MRISLLLLCCLSLFAVSLHAREEPAPTPFEDTDTGLYGYSLPSGEVVITPRFQMAWDFIEPEARIAPAIDDEGWAWIDRQGVVLLRPFIFDNWPDEFSEGLARYVEHTPQGERYGFFDRKGEIVIPASFDFVLPFEDGYAPFCMGCSRVYYGEHWSMEGGKWGCLDKKGNVKEQFDPDADNPCVQ